jgi:hypothetical protein
MYGVWGVWWHELTKAIVKTVERADIDHLAILLDLFISSFFFTTI